MLCRVLTMLAVSAMAGAAWAEEPEETPTAIMVSLRFCESDLDGGRESIKVLSEPRVLTLNGQSATITVGGEKELEGHKDHAVIHGVHCDITSKLIKKDAVLLNLHWECTELVDDEREDSVTAQGTCIRSSLVIKPGEKVRIGGLKRNGRKSWIEATVDVIPPGEVIAMKRR